MTDSVVQRWRAAAGPIWRRYDDSADWLVFNPASADLHLLTDSAYRLWVLTGAERPLSFEDLVSALASEMARAPDDELTEATRATLAFMDRAGLVHPVSS